MKVLTKSDLCAMQGKATNKNAQCLSGAEIALLHTQIDEWQINDIDGILQLHRRFPMTNFVTAMGFARLITEIAERNDHHPKLVIEYDSVTVNWWSHSIGGLHLNDFAAAAKTDKAFANL
ncbi:MAG: 4a-hydroxytetrahydrobiopterin dehydratase [Porticoccaceae bacterium]